ncbi:MAG: NAD(P)H-hydrate epimerase [Candidatus Omnitrophica bacterium]|nr:NAD(P)H-hydrate epimerase [Candidatus Omnitrophota bacterium]
MKKKNTLKKSELRDFDNKAKNLLGIPENILIENASRGILEVILKENLSCDRTCIFAGRGNNGADSLALTRHLLNRGLKVDIFLVLGGKHYNKEVEFQLGILKKIIGEKRIKVLNTEEDFKYLKESLSLYDLLVDGIFGIGFKTPLDSFHKELFKIINSARRPVLAVDIPSGLSCDSARIDQEAIKASYTVTFVAEKESFFMGKGPDYVGKIFVKDIGVSRDALKRL